MKKILVSIVLFFWFGTSFSQESSINYIVNPNSLQIEIGGNGLVYSLSFERILINGNKLKTSAQLGFAYYPEFIGILEFWAPVQITEIISFGNHHLEVGLGYIPIRASTREPDKSIASWDWYSLYTGRVGYRYQPPDSKWLLRAGYTPIIMHEPNSSNKFETIHSAGLGMGFAF